MLASSVSTAAWPISPSAARSCATCRRSGRSVGWSTPKPRFAGPEAVLAYLSRYTHRVAISNSRLFRFDDDGVTFRFKNYRRGGTDRQQVMTLTADEFIRRFLLYNLPKGFHRIRHYGLLASGTRRDNLAHIRRLLDVTPPSVADVAPTAPR